jgi:hypothetical protein
MCKCETSRKKYDKARNKEGRGEAGTLDSKTTVRVRTSGTFCYDVILRLRKRSYWSYWSYSFVKGVSLSTVKHRADDAAPAASALSSLSWFSSVIEITLLAHFFPSIEFVMVSSIESLFAIEFSIQFHGTTLSSWPGPSSSYVLTSTASPSYCIHNEWKNLQLKVSILIPLWLFPL